MSVFSVLFSAMGLVVARLWCDVAACLGRREAGEKKGEGKTRISHSSGGLTD